MILGFLFSFFAANGLRVIYDDLINVHDEVLDEL